jgi:hypothetical protein
MFIAKLDNSENPVLSRGLVNNWLDFSNHTLQTDKAAKQLTKAREKR